MIWEKVTLVGVGLLGGSLGRALRSNKLAGSVCGLVRREESIREAVECHAVDHATLDPQDAVKGADLVVLCTPLDTMLQIAPRLMPALRSDALITDVGSVKRTVCERMVVLLGEHSAIFVGSHPMAGSEKSGVAHSSEYLFRDSVCAITPTSDVPEEAVTKIRGLWESVGGRVLCLDPAAHDRLVGRASHLPHVLATALAAYVLDPSADPSQKILCAGGFRDTTRIAAGDVTMWRDILLQNSDMVVEALGEYSIALNSFRDSVANHDSEAIAEFLQAAKTLRKDWAQ